MNNKYLEGCKKLDDGRYQLRESIQISNDTIVQKVITEKLTENVLNQELPIYSQYLVKLWAKDSKNKNKRNYSKVFNKVLTENKTTIGFMDHPQDGLESYKNVVLVCKNPQMIFDNDTKEEWLAVEVTFVGKPYGETCEAILHAGGFIEFSSSALGDVNASGYVLEDGFFLERYADVVVNSSNGQFYFVNKEEPRKEPTLDTKTLYDVKNEKVKVENLTINNTGECLPEKTGEKTMSDILNEKALELNIKSLLRDAEKEENLFEKRKQLEVAKEYAMNLTESTLVAQIEKSMTETDNSITDLAEKGKDVGSLNETISTLKAESATLNESLNVLKEEKKTLQENYDAIIKLYEDKQFEASQGELLNNKKLNVLIKSLKEELTVAKKQLAKVTERKNYFEALSNSKVETDDYIELKESIKDLSNKNKALKEQNANLLQDVRNLRRNSIFERTIERKERPRMFKTVEETNQYNEIMKEELTEKVEEPRVEKDSIVENILKSRGLI